MNEPDRERLRAAAERVLGDWHEAEDVAQEVLLRADPAAGQGWLHAVCYRLAVDRLRVRRRLGRAIAAIGRRTVWFLDPRREADRAAHAAEVREALAALEEPYRSALRLRYLEELSFPEIAARLETNERTARTWVGRGLVRLRRRLEDRS